MRARLRSLLHDLRRTAGGAATWGRYLLTADRLDLALGMIEVEAAASEGTEPGCRCRLRVANASHEAREPTLVLELAPGDREGSEVWVRLTQRLRVPPLGLTWVEMECSSSARALRVDGLPTLLEEEVSGTASTGVLLSIRARLLEGGRELHPPLVVYRKLGR